jgi:hypothetical protein
MANPKISHPKETKKSDQQLGTLIAAVLKHPDTPEDLFNNIIDALNELHTSKVSQRAEFIQAVIDGHNLEEKQKGGAA